MGGALPFRAEKQLGDRPGFVEQSKESGQKKTAAFAALHNVLLSRLRYVFQNHPNKHV